MRVFPVTWQRWRSHHSVHTWKSHAVCRLYDPIFYRTGTVIADCNLHSRNREFRVCLLQWPWTWPDDIHVRTWPLSHRSMMPERPPWGGACARWNIRVAEYNYGVSQKHRIILTVYDFFIWWRRNAFNISKYSGVRLVFWMSPCRCSIVSLILCK